MNLFNIVFHSVLALIGIGVLGFWILRRGIIPESVITVLSRLAIDIALPSVIFAGIVINFDPQKNPDWWQLPLWWLLFAIVALALTLLSLFVSRKSFRSEFALSLFFQNGLFFPIIIITGLFGSGSPYLVQLFIFIIFHPVIFFSTYHLFFAKKSDVSKKHLNLQRIINPVLIATMLAMGIVLLGIEELLPNFAVTMLEMLGSMTLPLIMIILGGSLFIDFQKKGELFFWEVLKFVLIKNVVFPLVFIALLLVIRPDYYIALIIFLQSAVPPITGVPIQVKRGGGNVSIANQFILGSFVFSIVTLPAMFLLFNMFFPMP
jgi:malate permease and related proteins